MTQQELDAALSLRFRAGLARFAESAEAALPYATVEEALADEEPTAAAAVQVLATAHVRRLADEVNSQPCGSPLERVMLHALLSVGTIMCDWGIAFASCAEGAHSTSSSRTARTSCSRSTRFTGSEVFADPIACAAQAVRASMGIKGERS